MDREQCIRRRSFFAAAQAYPVDDGGRFARIGWTAAPAKVRRPYSPSGPNAAATTDQALVGRIPEGILVAFRGTLPPVDIADGRFVPSHESLRTILLDWINDADAYPDHAGTYAGNVHHGFARSVESLWTGADGVEARIGRLLADGGPRRLYFTGHSKGGPLANLTAYRAKKTWPDVPVKVVTIAAARTGDQIFADDYERLGIDCLRYEVDTDLVPLLPFGAATPPWLREATAAVLGHPCPESFGYVPVGKARGNNSTMWQRLVKAALSIRQSLPWAKDRKDFLLPAIDAHQISANSLYNDLVCEKTCGHAWP